MRRCTVGLSLLVAAPSTSRVSGCSFLVANFLVDPERLRHANEFQQRRGPDATETLEVEGWLLLHNLLAITGDFTLQPFLASDKRRKAVSVFNGEVYNFQDLIPGQSFTSDGAALIPAYWKWGDAFGEHLDGEYALAILDLTEKKLVLLTDPFGTKPLFFGYAEDGRFAAASYRSALVRIGFARDETFMADPNTMYVATFSQLRNFSSHGRRKVKLSKGLVQRCGAEARGPCFSKSNDVGVHTHASPPPLWPFGRRFPVFRWNLTQHKHTTDDWIAAFRRAVAKRHPWGQLSGQGFIGLSSGYDSGAVHLSLSLSRTPHRVFTVRALENMTVLNRRLRIGSQIGAERIGVSSAKYGAFIDWLTDNVEPSEHSRPDGSFYGVLNDQASFALAFVLKRCKELDLKVHISGHGGDETISLYQTAPHFEFPGDLAAIFPWTGFYFGTMRNFLLKEETVAGAFGVETRYPFLDREVVQEFLALHQSVKNSKYKRPIHDFFKLHNYPFLDGVKDPFLWIQMLKHKEDAASLPNSPEKGKERAKTSAPDAKDFAKMAQCR